MWTVFSGESLRSSTRLSVPARHRSYQSVPHGSTYTFRHSQILFLRHMKTLSFVSYRRSSPPSPPAYKLGTDCLAKKAPCASLRMYLHPNINACRHFYRKRNGFSMFRNRTPSVLLWKRVCCLENPICFLVSYVVGKPANLTVCARPLGPPPSSR